MTKTKKTLMVSASVLSIVYASFALILSLILFLSAKVANFDMIKEILLQDTTVVYTDAEIQAIASLTRIVLTFGAVASLVIGIVTMIFAIKVLKNSSMQKTKLGSVITLLVFSILSCNLISAGLLIAVLCIKDKQINPNEDIVVSGNNQ